MNIFKATIIASTVLMAGGFGAQARDLTVVSWGGNFQDAQRKIFFEPFAAQTGKPVLDESWDGGYGVLQAKVKAGVPNWDVVEVEAEELALGCADGIYEKIDWDKLGGKAAYLPAAVSDCGVGNIVWSTGLSYDGDKLKDGPKTWADFWDTKKFPGKRGLRKGPKYALEFALMADGVPADQVYKVLSGEGGVDRAFKKLDALKADIIWWDAGAQPLQLLSSGQVVMTSAYNGRISGINRTEGKKFGFVFPGSVYAIDSWVILKDSPNKDAGMDFIAYASKAENQAKLPEFIAYGLPNLGATKLVPEQFQKELPTTEENISGAIPLDVDFWTDNSEELTQRFNAWLAQ
ncbi:ABC transporter substrate-binding protein [Rhizobium sp. YJ-22]|uniref:ABC transporter substrate-binding protein n=1 Tax=Rhizobium sp. YJ-22 TaxID=3037556 RepID=UPI000AF1C194|nr:ABC transporter substrate-binding protein [Rhizobium sp. YJ-22]MBN9032087.1 ABC transporter substrate-binding protein [Hyphomicrobiales bacterium]MDG3579681.1 ABC transporter substrate-binding protein [Rhizobium sp. YJ-22]